jgi:hypothetical protein
VRYFSQNNIPFSLNLQAFSEAMIIAGKTFPA